MNRIEGKILEKRAINKGVVKRFKNISDALKVLKDDFCAIPELAGIYELKTDNRIHDNNVSDHTKQVVSNLIPKNKYFDNLTDGDKEIILLSAYLHDIGKGPKSKWKNGIQYVYPDHPADGLSMLGRIMIEDFEELSNDQIKKICLLVGYHDLIGDILEKDRSTEELINLEINSNELNMLVALTIADVTAINFMWAISINSKISNFVAELEMNNTL